MPAMKRGRAGTRSNPIVIRDFKRPRVTQARVNRARLASKETGYVDLAVATREMSTTGTLTLIATVAQGASVNERIGKKIKWKSMQIRGSVRAKSSTIASAGTYMVVWDRRPGASLPAITDIMVTANQNSFTNDANSGRFRILKRQDYQVVGNDTTAGQQADQSAFVVNDFLDLKMRQGTFMAAGTGAIGDIEEGALYLITVGDTVTGNFAADLNVGIRTRFVDM